MYKERRASANSNCASVVKDGGVARSMCVQQGGIVHWALGTGHLQGDTGHWALWCSLCRVALGTVQGGTAGQLFSTSENPSCKLLCQPSRINLVFLILPVLPVLLPARFVFVNFFIVVVVV